MCIQRQLDKKYQDDNFLRDQLRAETFKIPKLSDELKQLLPATAIQTKDRIGSFLSSKHRSSGEYVQEDSALYNIDQKFGGKAQRRLTKRRGNPDSPSNRNYKGHKFKGCWVCKGNHRAAEMLSQEEIRSEFRKMKESRGYLSLDEKTEVFKTNEDDEDESG